VSAGHKGDIKCRSEAMGLDHAPLSKDWAGS
jgi:hypothetical protein